MAMHLDLQSGCDVMQVCLNGHVITERLTSDPESGRTHCDRCGAATLDHCLTCGNKLPGVLPVPGLIPVGSWRAPRYCATCGAACPWVRRPRMTPNAMAILEPLLRRLPLVIRQLRWRQGEKPPFRVEDDRDLEDLVRAVLPLHFDDVRLESRTPRYSARTRTDFLLMPARIALTVKFAGSGLRDSQLVEQWREDIGYYRNRGGREIWLGYAYDPAGCLRDREILESMLLDKERDMEVRLLVSGATENPSR
jgi:hypothetical protein